MVATLSAMEHAVTGGEVNGPKKDGTPQTCNPRPQTCNHLFEGNPESYLYFGVYLEYIPRVCWNFLRVIEFSGGFQTLKGWLGGLGNVLLG